MIINIYIQRFIVVFSIISCCIAAVCAAAAQTPDEQIAAASALFEAKRYDAAAAKLDAFVAASPRHAKLAAAAFTLGRCRTELKQYPQAVAAYGKAIAAKDPAITPLAQLGLGEAAMNARMYDIALTALQAATKSSMKPEQAVVAWFWQAQANYELKKYVPAHDAYEKVLKDYPKSDYADNAAFGMAMSDLQKGDRQTARREFVEMIDRYNGSDDRPRALLLVAQIDLDAKKYEEARRGFERFNREGGNKASAEMQDAARDGLIQSLLALKDWGAAIQPLEMVTSRMPATDPDRAKALYSLGNCRYHQKQFDQALSAWNESAKATDPQVASLSLYWVANAQLALNRTADAAKTFSQFATRYPKNELAAKARLHEGDAALAAHQPDAAAIAWNSLLSSYPQAPEAADARKGLAELTDSISDPVKLAAALKGLPLADRVRGSIRLGRIYLESKKYTDAQQILTEILKAKLEPPVAGEAQYLLGLAWDAQDKSANAASALSDAVKLAPSAAYGSEAHGRLAWLYLELKRPADAEREAASVLSAHLDENATRQARLAQIQAQLDQEKWSAALDGCKTLMASNPSPETSATLLYTQAWIAEKQDKASEALPLWEKLATQYPRSQFGDLALLRTGDARLKASKYDEARTFYTSLMEGFPKSVYVSEARFKLGSALYNLGRYPDAAVSFDAVASDQNAGDYIAESLYWAGVSYTKIQKSTEAIQRLEKLVAGYPKSSRLANARVRLAALKATSTP